MFEDQIRTFYKSIKLWLKCLSREQLELNYFGRGFKNVKQVIHSKVFNC